MTKKKQQTTIILDITDKLTSSKYRKSIRQARKQYQSGDTFTHEQVFDKI